MSTPDYTPPDGDATQVPKDVYEQIVARVKAECEAIGGVSERAYRRRLAKHIKRWKQIESSPHPSTIRGKGYYHSDPVFRVVSHDCRDNCVVCGRSREGATRLVVNGVMSGRFVASFDGRAND